MATMKMPMAVGTGTGGDFSTKLIRNDSTSWSITNTALNIAGEIKKVSANSLKKWNDTTQNTPLEPELVIAKGGSGSWVDPNGVTVSVALSDDGTTITATRSSGLGGLILTIGY